MRAGWKGVTNSPKPTFSSNNDQAPGRLCSLPSFAMGSFVCRQLFCMYILHSQNFCDYRLSTKSHRATPNGAQIFCLLKLSSNARFSSSFHSSTQLS